MDEIVTSSVATPQSTMGLLSGFAAVALLLGAIGIYGLVSYTVQQRTQEIGIRIALGASASEITRMIASEGLSLAAAGVGIGLALAIASARLLRTMLYAVEASDPTTLTATASLLLLVAVAACALPIRRALRLDPSTALRMS
jgi:putative ABC transport system permease protein